MLFSVMQQISCYIKINVKIFGLRDPSQCAKPQSSIRCLIPQFRSGEYFHTQDILLSKIKFFFDRKRWQIRNSKIKTTVIHENCFLRK